MSIKKSNFPASTTIPDSATFDYVYNNTNTKITKANLLGALGVTGTIEQEGNPLSTQVLDINGTVNKIRSLTDGSGITTSVNALNGIDIEHNFSQDGVGIPILHDLGAASPSFISLVAGAGMQFTVDSDAVTITATGTALPSTLSVAVNVIGDFPTAVSGVITLAADTTYILSNNISTSNRFVFSNNSSLVSHSVRSPLLTYTGSGTMFTGVDVNARLREVRITCPSAKVFDFSDTVGGTCTVSMHTVTCEACDTVGNIDDLFSFFADVFTCISIASEGWVFTGSNFTSLDLHENTLFSTSATFTAIDLGTSVSQNISIDHASIKGVSGAVGIIGAASNANLTASGFGEVEGCTFFGGMTALLSGITHDDVRWKFLGNEGIEDTRPGSLTYNTAGTTVTIGTSGVPVVIGGTWVDENNSHFTANLTGRVTYTGINPSFAPVSVSITADPATGSNKDFSIGIGVNGTAVAASFVPARASAGDLVSGTVIWEILFTNGDYAEAFLQNDTDTTNFTVSKAVLRIN